MLYPKTYKFLEYFRIKHGKKRQKILDLIAALNFKDFGFLEIIYRKFKMSTTVKGLSYNVFEIEKFKLCKRTEDKKIILNLLRN